MDPAEDQVNVGRYLRFVVAFLLIMFSALALYEYYYGAQARQTQELQERFDASNQPGASVVATTTAL